MNKNIVLVGFMGAGKTVTAQALADRLHYQVVSTDDKIIEREGRPINKIFAVNGESYFRDVETQEVCEAAQGTNLVIDCGGGVVLRKENIDALKQKGVVIYLEASPEVIYERVKDDSNRPLLNVDDPLKKINDLLAAREKFYAQADYEVLTDGKTADQVAEKIIEIIKDTEKPSH